MLQAFYPKEYFGSAYDIPYEEFYKRGVCGVIFDIDNTLVPHGAPADQRVKELFSRLHGMGMKTCLLSNNRRERVAPFAEQVDSPYIFKGGKPGTGGYERAMSLMGTRRETTLFVGDQLFTDVYGANRAGIYGILTRPIHPKEEIQIVLKRRLEAVVLYFYRREQEKGAKHKGKGTAGR